MSNSAHIAVATVVTLSAVSVPATASAQGLRDLPTSSTSTKSHTISTNPFLPLFGFFSAEYE